MSRAEVLEQLGRPHRWATRRDLLIKIQPDQPQIYIFEGFAQRALRCGAENWLIYFDLSKEHGFLVGFSNGELVFAKQGGRLGDRGR